MNRIVSRFALAAAAQVAIALFVDVCGADEITVRRESRGHTGAIDYHEDGEAVGNVAVFISGE